MEVSSKSNLNMYGPFLELARKLLNDPELEFKISTLRAPI